MKKEMSGPNFAISDLPVDVFELSIEGLEVESLTAGHGMPEHGASGHLSPVVSGCSCGSACYFHY
ncbi:thiomuracin/GE37468 family thiazolyl RiPP peptide [Micromonospora sp. DT46]|nr:thiomuracin/GE37468 family thiazolyl RiPP peptide [Micromonospora sp. NBC_01740]KAB1140522.1 GE37468 family thiazolyl peptide [Micromonospora sp. AMSO12t]WSF99924.1 GE37468 family thiazolyl peptide [Micromonospora sp. NBC_01740]